MGIIKTSRLSKLFSKKANYKTKYICPTCKAEIYTEEFLVKCAVCGNSLVKR